jgi:hypothetical protein
MTFYWAFYWLLNFNARNVLRLNTRVVFTYLANADERLYIIIDAQAG